MYHSKELPKDPLELDGAGAVADIGLHDQLVLVSRSQDNASAVCTVTKLLVITANTNVLDFIYLYFPLVGLENI